MTDTPRGPVQPPDGGSSPPTSLRDSIAGRASPTAGGSPPRPEHALQARLHFGRAQELLAGLAGCSSVRSADALLRTARTLGIVPTLVAERFLRSVAITDAEHAALVARLTTEVSDINAEAEADAQNAGDTDPEPTSGISERDHPPPFQVAPTPAGAPRGIGVHGEVDMHTAPDVIAYVRNEWQITHDDDDRDVAVVVLDLERVTFLDLAGLDALNTLYAEMARDGQRVAVTPPAASGPRRLLSVVQTRGWSVSWNTPPEVD